MIDGQQRMARYKREEILPFTPVIIIGAARSGTNALRDAICRLNSFETWPCDEINGIWRHGNSNHPNDLLTPDMITPFVRTFIRQKFVEMWINSQRPLFLIEKTCANSLRIPFIQDVLPEAKFLYMVRDGYDVLSSAKKRWEGNLEFNAFKYYLAKANYIPLSDCFYYASQFVRARIERILRLRKNLRTWGPRINDMSQMNIDSIDELVARQWVECVSASDRAVQGMNTDRVFCIKYETFVTDPTSTLDAILEWLGYRVSQAEVTLATSNIHSGSIGLGRRQQFSLPDNVRSALIRTLRAHDYKE